MKLRANKLAKLNQKKWTPSSDQVLLKNGKTKQELSKQFASMETVQQISQSAEN